MKKGITITSHEKITKSLNSILRKHKATAWIILLANVAFVLWIVFFSTGPNYDPAFVVLVTSGDNTGTGFVVGSAEHIITALDLIADQRDIGISFQDGQYFEGELIGYSGDDGIALVSLENASVEMEIYPLSTASSNSGRSVIIGYKDGGLMEQECDLGSADEYEGWYLTDDNAGDMVGSPVLSFKNKNIAGMVLGRARDNRIVPSERIVELCSQNGISLF